MLTPGLTRLLLAVIVVVHHSFPLRMGAWAVAMFFVLSGYWITRMWEEKYHKLENSYTNFIISRWWRVAPLYLCCQLIAAVVAFFQRTDGQRLVIDDWKWWITQPMVLASTQFGRLLPPAWSLDVEMQFYAVAPILIIGSTILARKAAIGALVGLVLWSAILFLSRSEFESARLDLYLWCFVTGMFIYRWKFQPARKLQMWSLLIFAMFVTLIFAVPQTRALIWQPGASNSQVSVSARVGFFLAASFVSLPFIIGTVFVRSGPWDRWCGDLSYSLYLVHWFARDWYYGAVDWSAPAWYNISLLGVNFLLAFLGAVLLLHLVDRPCQRLRARQLQPSIS